MSFGGDCWGPITRLKTNCACSVASEAPSEMACFWGEAVAGCLRVPGRVPRSRTTYVAFGQFILLRKALDAKSAPAGWGARLGRHVSGDGLG